MENELKTLKDLFDTPIWVYYIFIVCMYLIRGWYINVLRPNWINNTTRLLATKNNNFDSRLSKIDRILSIVSERVSDINTAAIHYNTGGGNNQFIEEIKKFDVKEFYRIISDAKNCLTNIKSEINNLKIKKGFELFIDEKNK